MVMFCNYISAEEYQTDLSKPNMVKFISDAPIEEFEGVTSNIDGYIKLDSFEELIESEIYLEVDLNTLDTGIGLRNRHMRENYLETDIYQYTYFQGKFDSISEVSNDEYKVLVEGTMFIHGERKDLMVKGKLKKTDLGFRITSSFELKLSDYKIDIPELMFMKINETMRLELEFNMMLMRN